MNLSTSIAATIKVLFFVDIRTCCARLASVNVPASNLDLFLGFGLYKGSLGTKLSKIRKYFFHPKSSFTFLCHKKTFLLGQIVSLKSCLNFSLPSVHLFPFRSSVYSNKLLFSLAINIFCRDTFDEVVLGLVTQSRDKT